MSPAAREPSLVRPWPTVLLWHDVPGGTDHVDWMLGNDPQGSEPLTTFRVDAVPTALGAGATCGARMIGDHRPAWLDREGDLSGGRGSVRRLARGVITRWQQGDALWSITVRWTAGSALEQQFDLHRSDGDCWRLKVIAADPPVGRVCNQ